MKWLKKENLLIDLERHEIVRMDNLKQSALKIENVQENKWKTN